MNLADRVLESTTTEGTGAITLDGPATGFQSFVAGIGNGNQCYYTIAGNAEWEVGIGTVTAGAQDTLSRDTVLASSNGGAKVAFSAGTKNVFVTAPATLLNGGAGSGLDADKVDGKDAAALLDRGNHTGTQTPATISPQGAGSGLDADTLDGVQASGFAAASHGHDAADLTSGTLDLARIPSTLTGKDADKWDGGDKTISSSAPSGGNPGDVWFRI